MAVAVYPHGARVARTAFSAALSLQFLDGLVTKFFLGNNPFFFFMREFHCFPFENVFTFFEREQEVSHGTA